MGEWGKVSPSGQMQEKLRNPSRQNPSLRQGLGSHSLVANSQRMPVNPGGQQQLWLKHVPPFKHVESTKIMHQNMYKTQICRRLWVLLAQLLGGHSGSISPAKVLSVQSGPVQPGRHSGMAKGPEQNT